MQATVKLVRKRRIYSEDFKKELVSLFEQGKFSVVQLGKLYGVNYETIYQWIYKFSAFNEKNCRVIEMKESSTSKLQALEQRVKELEQKLGQKQIKIDFLEKMIEIAEQELKVDIKKKSSTPRSTGSDKKARR